jgi:hypothetical protein
MKHNNAQFNSIVGKGLIFLCLAVTSLAVFNLGKLTEINNQTGHHFSEGEKLLFIYTTVFHKMKNAGVTQNAYSQMGDSEKQAAILSYVAPDDIELVSDNISVATPKYFIESDQALRSIMEEKNLQYQIWDKTVHQTIVCGLVALVMDFVMLVMFFIELIPTLTQKRGNIADFGTSQPATS